MTVPAMKIKSTWFKPGAAQGPAEQASAMAFITWRVAHQMLKRMRGAQFNIDAGGPYLAFMHEALVFLLAVVDRLAHERLGPEDRATFTIALVRHVARTLEENEADLLGPAAPGSAPYGERFIDEVNALLPHYAEFGGERDVADGLGFSPDFGFVRYLGTRLEPHLPPQDRRWVLDQVMAVEAPEALGIVRKAMKALYDPSPRPARRRSMSGE